MDGGTTGAGRLSRRMRLGFATALVVIAAVVAAACTPQEIQRWGADRGIDWSEQEAQDIANWVDTNFPTTTTTGPAIDPFMILEYPSVRLPTPPGVRCYDEDGNDQTWRPTLWQVTVLFPGDWLVLRVITPAQNETIGAAMDESRFNVPNDWIFGESPEPLVLTLEGREVPGGPWQILDTQPVTVYECLPE